MTNESSDVVTLYDSSGKAHRIRVTYMELPPSESALKFNVPANSMYLGGP